MRAADETLAEARHARDDVTAGLDLPALGYKCTECVPSAKAVHYVMART